MATGGRDPNDKNSSTNNGFHPFKKPAKPGAKLSEGQVADQARDLLVSYVFNQVHFDSSQIPNADTLRQPGTPSGPPIKNCKDVAKALIRIADEIDADEAFNRQMVSITPDMANKSLFMTVALEVFDGGNVITWGRIVSIFHFAYRLALKSLGEIDSCIKIVRRCVEWIVEFIRNHIAAWIINQGGWEAVIECISTPQFQLVSFLSLTIATIAWIYWRR